MLSNLDVASLTWQGWLLALGSVAIAVALMFGLMVGAHQAGVRKGIGGGMVAALLFSFPLAFVIGRSICKRAGIPIVKK